MSYSRVGSYLVSSELAADPFGRILRGISLEGHAFERHHLLRSFTDEVAEAGLGARIQEIQRVAGMLTGSRGFGANYQVEAGKPIHIVCDYIPGRSLAQVLDKTREEQIPLGVDHALTVTQGLTQALMTLETKDLHHGCLSPHSVWVSFEGATHVIDAPHGPAMAAVLPRLKALEPALAPYLLPAGTPGLQQDLFALGSILYELLTLEKLPSSRGGTQAIADALGKATLKAAQEDGPVPAEIASLLRRLLAEPQSFASMSDFNKELERVLYDGDYSPTTFNMAFYMHTLFREESDQDAQAMKADQTVNYAPFLAGEGEVRSEMPKDGTSRVKFFVMAGAVLVAAFATMGWFIHRKSAANEELLKQLAAVQREKSANEDRLKEISKQEEAQKQLEAFLSKSITGAKTAEERATAKQELEAAKAKAEELARQKAEALKKSQELANATSAIQSAQKAGAPKAPAAAAPAPAQPAPAPVQAQAQAPAPPPVQQAPAPAPVVVQAPPPAAPAAAADERETPPVVTQRVVPQAPRINRNLLAPNVRDQDMMVSLKVFVNAQGKAVRVVMLSGAPPNLPYNATAEKAALDSGYSPATRGGKPVPGWVTLDYHFGKPR